MGVVLGVSRPYRVNDHRRAQLVGNRRARTPRLRDRSPEIRTLVGVSSGYRANDHRAGARSRTGPLFDECQARSWRHRTYAPGLTRTGDGASRRGGWRQRVLACGAGGCEARRVMPREQRCGPDATHPRSIVSQSAGGWGLLRGAGSGGRGFGEPWRAAGRRGLRREQRSATDADPGNPLELHRQLKLSGGLDHRGRRGSSNF